LTIGERRRDNPKVSAEQDNFDWRTIPGSRYGLVRSVTIGYDRRHPGPWPSEASQAKARIPEFPQLETNVLFENRGRGRVIRQLWVATPDGRLPKHGIDWTVLRAIKLDQIQREVDHLIAREEELGRLPAKLAAGLRKRPGRVGRDDVEYARVAAAYVAALGSRAPVRRVAEKLGLLPETVRDLLHEARRRGLLTKLGRGKAGGTLTEKALNLLGDAEG
jgi:hypothetical protein